MKNKTTIIIILVVAVAVVAGTIYLIRNWGNITGSDDKEDGIQTQIILRSKQ